jgi:hypothetical protein
VSLELLKNEMKNDITPLDVISSVLYYLKEDEFSTNYEKIHRAFFKVKDSELLKEFAFRTSGPYPYSELLENVFSRLTISGLLGCRNPDFERFTIEEKQRKRIEKGALRKFSEEQKKELASISKIIRKDLSLSTE